MLDRIWLVIHGVTPSLWSARVLTKRQTVGRASDCNVRVVHRTVSRRHAELWREGDTLYLHDLNSRNGTFINGVRVATSTFSLGDTIQMGDIPMHVVNSARDDSFSAEDDTELRHRSSEAMRAMYDRLSPGQLQVATLLLRGLGEKEVAERLCLSRHTVHTHVKHIYKCLDVQSRSQMLAKYLGNKR